MKFKKGMTVIQTLTGIGPDEVTEKKIHSVRKGIVYLADSSGDQEQGVTFDAKTGKELENFFLPMRMFIVPKQGGGEGK